MWLKQCWNATLGGRGDVATQNREVHCIPENIQVDTEAAKSQFQYKPLAVIVSLLYKHIVNNDQVKCLLTARSKLFSLPFCVTSVIIGFLLKASFRGKGIKKEEINRWAESPRQLCSPTSKSSVGGQDKPSSPTCVCIQLVCTSGLCIIRCNTEAGNMELC